MESVGFSGQTEGFLVSRTFLREKNLGVYLDVDLLGVECRENHVGVLEVVMGSIASRVSKHGRKTVLPGRKGQHPHEV